MLAYIPARVDEDPLDRIEYPLEPLAILPFVDNEVRTRGPVAMGHRDPGGNCQHRVPGRFAEAVEVTAVQRGCERWRP